MSGTERGSQEATSVAGAESATGDSRAAPMEPIESLARRAVAFIALTLGFAGATMAVGWWGIPIVGAAWGVWAGRDARPGVMIAPLAATSAVAAWTGLLIWTGVRGPLGLLATTLGAVIGLPAAVLVVVTLGFAALLAWSAAALCSSLAGGGKPAAGSKEQTAVEP
jgi:hypothetical protein